MLSIESFINKHGITFKIERNGSVISELRGVNNHEKSSSKKYISFMPDSDVQYKDWLINPANERLFVLNTYTDFFAQKKVQLKAYYQTVTEYNSTSNAPTNIFNIENATGSIIGTQANVTLNFNDSIQQTREQINTSNSNDKEELQQIINLLEMVVNNQVPVQKGLLSKFSAVIQKNSWIASPISSIILNWLITQVH